MLTALWPVDRPPKELDFGVMEGGTIRSEPKVWQDEALFTKRQPGFISTQPHRAIGDPTER
jgi:hypothetical protein